MSEGGADMTGERTVKLKPRTPQDRAFIEGGKLAGKVARESAKMAGKGISKSGRLAGRNVLGAKVGLGVAALAVSAGFAAGKPAETKAGVQEFVDDPVRATREVAPVVRDALVEAVDDAISKARDKSEASARSETVISPEDRKTIDEVIDVFYPGTSENDREELGNQIKITAEYMKDILTSESYQNLKNNEKLVESLSLSSGIPKEIFWGLCMAESRCGVDGNEPNSAGALGPVQITEEKALDYGLVVTNDENDDRLKWDRALAVAAMDISHNTRFFSGEDASYQNWGLGVWSWHKGQTGVKQEIESYSANMVQSYTDLPEYVRGNNITVKTILDILNIRKRLEDPNNNYDTTTIFTLRAAGGALLVKNLEKIADHVEAQQ